VAEDRLRFDFTHFKDIDQLELERIEEIVNSYIADNYRLEVKQMILSEAKKSGALAFFGEKYADKVRVVSIADFSMELCGGTHLDSTGKISLFKIIQEGSVAAGVRRIEAVTGSFAYKAIREEEAVLNDISSQLNVPPEKIRQELEKRLSRIKELEKKLNLQSLGRIKNTLDTMIQNADKIKEVKVITEILENTDMDLLRKTVDMLKEKTDHCLIVLGTTNQGRALLVMGVTADLVQKGLDASKLILEPAQIIGGSGGGRKDFAQAGGNKPENFRKAFQELKNIINSQ
jgi:alanyl-tRNA synthetase